MILLYPGGARDIPIRLPYDLGEIESVEIDFIQDGSVRFTKAPDSMASDYDDDGNEDGTIALVTLMPTDTDGFISNRQAYMQARINLGGGVWDIMPAEGIGICVTYKDRKRDKRKGCGFCAIY